MKNIGELALEIAKWDLGYFHQYLDNVSGQLESNQKEFNQWYRRSIGEISEEDRVFYETHYGSKLYEHNFVQPFILYSMHLVSCMALLESKLNEVCCEIREYNKISLALNDINGNGIHRARIFLKKVVGVDFPDQEPVWNEIVTYQRVRNFIIHNNSTLDESENAEAVWHYARTKDKIFRVHEDRSLWFSKEYCYEVVEVIAAFFEKIYPLAYAKVHHERR